MAGCRALELLLLPSWGYSARSGCAAVLDSEAPSLCADEADEVQPRHPKSVADIGNPWAVQVAGRRLLADDCSASRPRQTNHKGIGGVSAAAFAHELWMIRQDRSRRSLDGLIQWHKQSRLRFRPRRHLILAAGEFVPHNIDRGDLSRGDHRFDVPPQRWEHRGWQEVAAAVQQRTRVERVERGHATRGLAVVLPAPTSESGRPSR